VLLIAGWMADLLAHRRERGNKWDAASLAAGLLSPFVLLVATVLLAARTRLQRSAWLRSVGQPGPGAFALALSPLLLLPPDPVDAVRLAAFGGLTATLLAYGQRRIVVAATALLTVAATAALFADVRHWPRFARTHLRQMQPQLTFAAVPGSEAEAARWAAAHTPPDALFLVPPSYGAFRHLAGRAIVADFKSIPYQDGAMLEWHGRLLDCCGPLPEGTLGFAAARVMDNNYSRLGDMDLQRLAQRYGAGYALLFHATATTRPVLHANEELKIVRLAP
jgi:hypothetical protein